MVRVDLGCVPTKVIGKTGFQPTITISNEGSSKLVTFYANTSFESESGALKFCQAIANVLKDKSVREAFDKFGNADLLITKEGI